MPAVAGFKKQGANNGACLAFLISTPESGVDSIALTYSLLDPIMTVMRPFAAFVTGAVAGIIENFTGDSYRRHPAVAPDRTCLVDACCDGIDCDPAEHARHHTFLEKFRAGMSYAFDELMKDLAKWFMLGILLAGIIAVCVPESLVSEAFGAGILGYLAVLAVSLPMYICASMSTPVAAALILKGMSPGAALVLLMAGPATNMATITMVGGILGKRTLAIYLLSIVLCTLGLAFLTDLIYSWLGISVAAVAGTAAGELIPAWLELAAAVILAVLIIRVYLLKISESRLVRTLRASGRKEENSAGCSCADAQTGAG